MYAFISKKKPAIELNHNLKIKNKGIEFFISPVKESSSFFSSEDMNQWHLCFFLGSRFEQNLYIQFEANNTGQTWLLGRAIWLDNKGDSANDAKSRVVASTFLRNSNTLALDRGKALTSERMLIADRDGIAYFSNSEDQFRRIVLCQALAIAYKEVLYDCMAQMTKHVKSDSTDLAITLYEEILRFNAADYFSFPILLERHELAAAWQILSEHYHLRMLNQELTQQLSDVAALLREEREHKRVEQENKEYKKDKQRGFWLTLFGIALTATSLLSLVQLTPKQFADTREAWVRWWKDSDSVRAPVLNSGASPIVKLQSASSTTHKK